MCIRDRPDSFGDLRVSRSLYLDSNRLSSLNESFGSIRVGRDLHLNDNLLSSLPDSFSGLQVGGAIYLHNNPVDAVPGRIATQIQAAGGKEATEEAGQAKEKEAAQ
eukprot:TRINITY_DN8043_c0_g2_i1.p1 TRINITY_DN8043_c0_g2~~TRINITY_DN8043_c0_g2_i1.p1  ORF type:complete len:106 (-),score=24.84 TRINITY_DN8043_c0_g2_i1:475-792(-)